MDNINSECIAYYRLVPAHKERKMELPLQVTGDMSNFSVISLNIMQCHG